MEDEHKPKRRRKTENEELYSSFTLTGDHYITSNGKHHSNIPMCICNYCDIAHRTGRRKDPPRPMNRTKQKCESHLSKCEHANHISIPKQESAASKVRPYDPQEAAAATGVQAGTGAAIVAALHPTFPESEKRPRRATRNDNLYSHFTVTNEPYITATGVAHVHIHKCVCNYCADAYAAGKPEIPKPPGSMVRSKRNCENHLKLCKFAPKGLVQDADTDVEDATIKSTGDAASKKPAAKPQLHTPASPAARRQMSTELTYLESEHFKRALVDFVVDAELPLETVEKPSFRRMVECVRPRAMIGIPADKEEMLTHRANTALQTMRVDIKRKVAEGRHAGLVLDGRKGIGCRHGYAITVTTGDQSFAYDCQLALPESHSMAIAREVEAMLRLYCQDPHGLTFSYFCSTNNTEQESARQILALRYPAMICNRCFSSQTNQLFRSFLLIDRFQNILKVASVMAATINIPGNEWAPKLLEKIEEQYGENVSSSITCVRENCWGSILGCFCSIMRIKSACQSFALWYKDGQELPMVFGEWANELFWHQLEEAEAVLRPLAEVSFFSGVVGGRTMAHAMLCYLNLYKRLRSNEEMVTHLNSCWSQEEHHLYFLAFALHPCFRDTAVLLLDASEKQRGNWSDDRNAFSRARLQHAAKFYYGKFNLYTGGTQEERHKEELKLTARIGKWLKGKSLEGVYEPADGWASVEDPVAFWLPHETEHGAFVRLAKYLLCAPIQTASCDSLVLDSEAFLPKGSARMPPEIYRHKMQIKNDVRRKQQSSATADFVLLSPTEYTTLGDLIATVETAPPPGQTISRLGSDSGFECVGSNEGEVQRWIDSLMLSIPQVTVTTSATVPGGKSNGEYDSDEDAPEVKSETLETLPDDDDPSFPKEDERYFSTKNYVRNDKFRLEDMLGGGAEIPSIGIKAD